MSNFSILTQQSDKRGPGGNQRVDAKFGWRRLIGIFQKKNKLTWSPDACLPDHVVKGDAGLRRRRRSRSVTQLVPQQRLMFDRVGGLAKTSSQQFSRQMDEVSFCRVSRSGGLCR